MPRRCAPRNDELINVNLDIGAKIDCHRPTYQNLLGRVEHVSQLGALVTNFLLIKPGALHQANGGYLLLDVFKLLSQPFAWEGLKRALFTREIRIESLGQMVSLVSTVSLEPEPIPLNAKVILLGNRLLYYLLAQYDPDFSELFKVAADFEDEVERSADNDLLYARLIGTLVRRDTLQPFDRDAVARVSSTAPAGPRMRINFPPTCRALPTWCVRRIAGRRRRSAK